MKDDRRSGRIKKYGVCLNEKCEMYKQIQEIQHGEYVCSNPECGKKLSPCAPPKKGGGKKNPLLIALGVLVVIALVLIVIFLLPKSGSKVIGANNGKDSLGVDTTVVDSPEVKTPPVDTVPPKDTTILTPPQPKDPRYGTVDLGYAKYTGDLKNGKPHGHGKLTYKRSQKIVSSQEYVASPGDTYEGDFRDGRISAGTGYWTHNGNVVAIMP